MVAQDPAAIFNRVFGRTRLPDVRQSEISECGLACLAMVSWYHGYRADLVALRQRLSTSSRGTTLQALAADAEQIGFTTRSVRFDLEDLPYLRTPCILHWDMDHFVVLAAVKRKGIVIHDPARGPHFVSNEEASSHITGIAMELVPTPAFEQQKDLRRPSLWDFWRRIRGLAPFLLQLFGMALVMQVFALAAPLYSQLVVDEAIAKGDRSLLNVLALGFTLLLLVQVTAEILRAYVGMYFSNMLGFQMEMNLFKHLIRLPASFFEKRHMGDIMSRFGSLGPIRSIISNTSIALILDGLMAAITLTLMFMYSWVLTVVELTLLAIFLGVRLATFSYLKRRNEDLIQLEARQNTLFLENVRSARAIKIFGREELRTNLWQNSAVDTLNSSVRLSRFGIWGGAGNSLIWGIGGIVSFYIAAGLVSSGAFTIGMLFAFQMYRGMFSGKAIALVNQLIQIKMTGLHLERLGDIVSTPREEDESAGNLEVPIKGGIRVENLSFAYAPREQPVLRNVNLSIAPGECVVVTGPSGGGKTSLVKLLVGLLRPDAGEIWIDGYPLSLLQLRAFRRQVGVVMQDDVLLSGTLADNIAFFDPDADQEKVQACAAAASLHDDIMRMPMGYRTLVGDMGSTLSVGQRQRLFLARALYHDPRILIVDEGTANLDRESEGRVIDHLATLPITRIIVAHRPRAFSIADRFFAVVNGSVMELDRDQVAQADGQKAAPSAPPAGAGGESLEAAE